MSASISFFSFSPMSPLSFFFFFSYCMVGSNVPVFLFLFKMPQCFMVYLIASINMNYLISLCNVRFLKGLMQPVPDLYAGEPTLWHAISAVWFTRTNLNFSSNLNNTDFQTQDYSNILRWKRHFPFCFITCVTNHISDNDTTVDDMDGYI